MIWVTPPSMTATHELVVPRSIPMTLPMGFSSSSAQTLSGLNRYFDSSWTEQSIAELEPALKDEDDRVVGHVLARLRRDGFMELRVERLILRIDRLEAESRQRVHQLFVDQGD